MRPHRCAAIPFIGNASARKGFFDTGQDLPGWDPHVYISVDWVEEAARTLGWVPVHQSQALRRELAKRDERIAELEAQVAEHEKFRDAAEYTLSTFDTRVRNKPGRKPREEAVA